MAEGTSKRKLAAILSADVAGYGRMMQDDEAATVATLQEYRTAIGRVIESRMSAREHPPTRPHHHDKKRQPAGAAAIAPADAGVTPRQVHAAEDHAEERAEEYGDQDPVRPRRPGRLREDARRCLGRTGADVLTYALPDWWR